MSEQTMTITFNGKSGKQYTFNTYSKDTSFRDVSAVYIFTKRACDSRGFDYYHALYIGESGQLGTRIATHEKWSLVNRYGCTHIAIMQVSGESNRLTAETDLIHGQNPPCNLQ